MNELDVIDRKVNECDLCGEYVEKFLNSKTVYLGKDNDILLIGEAPANNGWRKSKMLWRDINGKILPSGVVLQKLFKIIDRNIFATTFIEAIKCYPRDRKYIKICAGNCKDIMMCQIKILNPKIIIPLGEAATRMLLDVNFKKFGDVVGKVFEMDDAKIIPIYHPSPVSPMSYKGNVPIFETIKEILKDT